MAASAALRRLREHLDHVDGVMLGRAAYQEPWRLLEVDPRLFGEAAPYATMKDVFEAMLPYIEDQLAQGARLHSMTRHFVGAFHGVPGARAFRRHLAENGVRPGAGVDVLRDAIARVEDRRRRWSRREDHPVARMTSGVRAASRGPFYFAWGCFRYFVSGPCGCIALTSQVSPPSRAGRSPSAP